MTKVTIIVVNYNTAGETNECLDSINAHADISFGCILIDNNSEKTDYEAIKDYAWLKKYRMDRNLGFAKACNFAASRAEGDYLFFLNSDAVVTEGCVSGLSRNLTDHDSAKAVVPRVCFHDSKELIDKGLGEINDLGFGWHPEHLQSIDSASDDSRETAWGSGCALLIKTTTFMRLNGFDRDFFMYEEDKDLCIRVRKEGGSILYSPQETVYHGHSASVSDKDSLDMSPFQIRYKSRNRAKLLSKNVPALVLILNAPIILASFLYWNYIYSRQTNFSTFFTEFFVQLYYFIQGYRQRDPLTRDDWNSITVDHSTRDYIRMWLSREEVYTTEKISELT